MIVRDLFCENDEARVIARAIFEDGFKRERTDGWIEIYYTHLMKIRESKVRKSDIMFYLSVENEDGRLYGNVSGFCYSDIKEGVMIPYAIEVLNYRQYAGLYVPEYTVQRYGSEAVAAEALREYGWHGCAESIACPEEVRKKVWTELETMEHKLFLMDSNYFERCRKQFRASYEGKKVPEWEGAEKEEGVKNSRSCMCQVVVVGEKIGKKRKK